MIHHRCALTDVPQSDLREREFEAVRAALDAAGLPSADFGRFTRDRYPDVIRPSVFDYRGAVPVLLAMLDRISHPRVLSALVRSLTSPFARPTAAVPLMALFRRRTAATDWSLKWAIGNALATVATPVHRQELLLLALEPSHGIGRQMIVQRLGRIRNDAAILEALHRLATDPDVALHAQAGLRRQLGNEAAATIIRPLLTHESEGVRRGAIYNLRMQRRASSRLARKAATPA